MKAPFSMLAPVLVAALPIAASAQTGASPIDVSVAQSARQLVITQRAAGVSYAIVRDGSVAAVGATGLRDLATQSPVTVDTLFRIGSITKMFTAVAIMQLAQAKRLSLGDTLARYQPEVPQAGAITIADLLMHRSGIPNYGDAAIADGRVRVPTTAQRIVDAQAKLPSEFTPGSQFSYSNTNYVILGRIVERLSGMSLAAYERRYILRPAGMERTFVGALPPGTTAATGYDLSSGPVPANPGDASWYYACGDIWSTARDLALFDIALMDGKLLDPAWFTAMIDAARPSTLGPHVEYGFGVSRVAFGDRVLVGHHGGLPGFESDNVMIVPDRFAIVVLANDYKFPTRVVQSAALTSAYPAQTAAAEAQATADARAQAVEDPALTRRFTAFVNDVLADRIPGGLDDAMAAALTPAAVAELMPYYAGDGAFVRLQFLSSDAIGEYRRFHYLAAFSQKKQPMTFVLDANGLIGGFFNQ